MSNLDIILLVICGLWLYGRCCAAAEVQEYRDLIDEKEPRDAGMPDASHRTVTGEC